MSVTLQRTHDTSMNLFGANNRENPTPLRANGTGRPAFSSPIVAAGSTRRGAGQVGFSNADRRTTPTIKRETGFVRADPRDGDENAIRARRDNGNNSFRRRSRRRHQSRRASDAYPTAAGRSGARPATIKAHESPAQAGVHRVVHTRTVACIHIRAYPGVTRYITAHGRYVLLVHYQRGARVVVCCAPAYAYAERVRVRALVF